MASLSQSKQNLIRSGISTMVQITYIDHLDNITMVDVKTGLSVMDGAAQNSVPGIDAICGGACSCATCHVYVEESWLVKLPPPSEAEFSMLECACDVRSNSRLSCQINVSDELEGLVVRIAAHQ
jgi:ferredoxin, 2Fe-2S